MRRRVHRIDFATEALKNINCVHYFTFIFVDNHQRLCLESCRLHQSCNKTNLLPKNSIVGGIRCKALYDVSVNGWCRLPVAFTKTGIMIPHRESQSLERISRLRRNIMLHPSKPPLVRIVCGTAKNLMSQEILTGSLVFPSPP